MVLRWYRRHGRDLPWRRTSDPYAILVSEIMLQQTQVARVVPKYREFLSRFPTIGALAAAPLRDILRCWSGLGYNRRARQLWECARIVAAQHRGRVPRDLDSLRALPGIGQYTAGAIASFAFAAREPAVDTNVRRVLSRAVRGFNAAPGADVWATARAMLPQDAATWNHALMDIGALFCRAKPRCDECPLHTSCLWVHTRTNPSFSKRHRVPRSAAPSTRFDGSRRQFRGRVIRALTKTPSLSLMQLGPQVKDGFGKTDVAWLHDLLADLERDGLVAFNRPRQRVALP